MGTATLAVKYKYFRDMSKSWAEMFNEAAEFAASIGPERLINISHSHTGFEGVIAVWYWGEPSDANA